MRATQVGEVRVEATDRVELPGAAPSFGDLVGHAGRPRRVPGPQAVRRTVPGCVRTTERAQRLEHPEPRGLARLPDDEGAVDQVGQRSGVTADRHHRAVLHRSREDRHPVEQRPLLPVEQAVRPRHDVAQRTVSG